MLLLPGFLAEKLEGLRKKIAENIIQETGFNVPSDVEYIHIPESLTLYMGAVPVPISALNQPFGTYWKKVEEEINAQRLCFYDGLHRDLVFQPLKAVNQTEKREAERDFFKGKIKQRTGRGYTGFNWYVGCKFHSLGKDWGTSTVLKTVAQESGKNIAIPVPYASFQRSTLFLEQNQGDQVHLRFNEPGALKPNTQSLERPQPFTYLVKDLPLWDLNLMGAFATELDEYARQGDPYMEKKKMKTE